MEGFAVGDVVEVFWDGDNEWFEGEIIEVREGEGEGPSGDGKEVGKGAREVLVLYRDFEVHWEEVGESVRHSKKRGRKEREEKRRKDEERGEEVGVLLRDDNPMERLEEMKVCSGSRG